MAKQLLILIFISITFSFNYSYSLDRFAMGSCNKQYKPQPLWPVIEKTNPELFLWLGDVIYADTEDMNIMQSKYAKQLSNKNYAKFISSIPVIGTWDDHDYGANSGNANYPKKAESQQLFLDFLGEPENSLRRQQEGVYSSYTYGQGQKKVKFLVLDTRYNRTKNKKDRNNILGETQWNWLEKELTNSDAKIHFLVSSHSVLASKLFFSEEWKDAPVARKRLFNLIKKTKPSGLMILTGDRHFSGYIQKTYGNYKFHEIMASGLTHSQNIIMRTGIRRLYGKGNYSFGLNFGLMDIFWDASPLQIKFSVLDVNKKVKFVKSFEMLDNKWELTTRYQAPSAF